MRCGHAGHQKLQTRMRQRLCVSVTATPLTHWQLAASLGPFCPEGDSIKACHDHGSTLPSLQAATACRVPVNNARELHYSADISIDSQCQPGLLMPCCCRCCGTVFLQVLQPLQQGRAGRCCCQQGAQQAGAGECRPEAAAQNLPGRHQVGAAAGPDTEGWSSLTLVAPLSVNTVESLPSC